MPGQVADSIALDVSAAALYHILAIFRRAESMNVVPGTIDLEALENDLNDLRDELRAQTTEADGRHLRKMIWWGRACTALGWGTAWIFPNPIAAFFMSLGIFSRWGMVAHHVIHRGYDRVDGLPPHLHSKRFAQGFRRFLDWPDWMDPEAWRHEHNTLHHYRLGEEEDPDQPEHNLDFLRTSRVPVWLRYIGLFVGAALWKIVYYPPNIMRMKEAARQKKKAVEAVDFFDRRVWLPWHRPGRDLWLKCWVPYFTVHFVLLPLPFLLISRWAYISVLCTRLMAEVMTNFHAFLMIVPNHAGSDLYRFETPISGRGDFYLRQIVGSTNYRTGGDLNDFLHGWLNYQIEHHLWPDLTMLQYRRARPRVIEICERHGIPYVQESVFARLTKLLKILAGQESMKVWPTGPAAELAAAE